MAPKKKTSSKKASDKSEDEDYLKKRSRNNEAVKKSRVKSKQRAEETKSRVDILKVENTVLEERIKEKEKNLKQLKDLFLEGASAKKDKVVDLHKLLNEEDD